MPTFTRRHLLKAAPALLTAPANIGATPAAACLPSVQPDAELMEALDRWEHACQMARNIADRMTDDASDAMEDEFADAVQRRDQIMREALAVAATTPQGLLAKLKGITDAGLLTGHSAYEHGLAAGLALACDIQRLHGDLPRPVRFMRA